MGAQPGLETGAAPLPSPAAGRAVRPPRPDVVSPGDGFSFVYLSSFYQSYSGSDTVVSPEDKIMKIRDSPFLENSAVQRGALPRLGADAPRNSRPWQNVMGSGIPDGSFPANDSKYLEEGMPCGIHAGIPPSLAAAGVTAEYSGDCGVLW